MGIFSDYLLRKKVKPEMDNIDFIQSMQRLDVKDGDILVLRHSGYLSIPAHNTLRDAFQETIKGFGYDVRILVLEEGMDVGVLRQDDYVKGEST